MESCQSLITVVALTPSTRNLIIRAPASLLLGTDALLWLLHRENRVWLDAAGEPMAERWPITVSPLRIVAFASTSPIIRSGRVSPILVTEELRAVFALR
jgi:hypothetical protein